MHKIILFSLTMLSKYLVFVILVFLKCCGGNLLRVVSYVNFIFIYVALPNISSSLSVDSETMAVSSCRVMN